ncbi:MAG: response regulator [Acidobacteria bacterium]|nr:response regulator [Acidobacteriota bacterium]
MSTALGGERPFEVLIVEDNPGDVFLLQMALETVRFPLHITVVSDGDAAIQYILAKNASTAHPRPDVMLLDLNLPKKSGYEVLTALRKHEEASGVPVLIVSSSDATKDIRQAYELGAHGYIQKRSDLDDLKQVAAGIEAFCISVAERAANADSASA